MLLIVFGIIFFLNFWFQSLKQKKGKIVIAFFAISIFYILLLGVKETADTYGYILYFENPEIKTDFLFRYLSNVFRNLGLTFFELYQLHIVLYGLLFTYFITRFTNNSFLVLIFYLSILYVPLVNQIRYFLALGFLLNGFYFFYFTKRKYLSFILFALAILSHSAIILFYGFIFLNKYSSKENYLKRCYIMSGILFMIIFSLNSLGLRNYLGNYLNYFNSEGVSSLAGGVYNILPYVIFLLLLHRQAINAQKKYTFFENDKTFQILYRLSLFSIIFIPISLNIQIFAHRYVHASLIVWLCFYCYTLRQEKSFKIVLNHTICITIAMIGLFYYTYFFSEIALNQSASYLSEFIKSFNSVDYLPNIVIN